MTPRLLALVLLVVGVGLMIPFEAWYTRLAGVLCLLGFVACGVYAIATPEFLGSDDDGDDAAAQAPGVTR